VAAWEPAIWGCLVKEPHDGRLGRPKKRVKVYYASEDKVLKPKVKDLDQYEKESGFKLPDDYREFARTFGPGTFDGWQISTPGFPNAEHEVDLAKLNERLRRSYLPNFVRFCGKEDFHGWFAWNPEDITDPVKHHYGVYLLGGLRGEDPEAQPIKVASSFHEFFISYALGGGFELQQKGARSKKSGDPVLPKTVAFSQVLS